MWQRNRLKWRNHQRLSTPTRPLAGQPGILLANSLPSISQEGPLSLSLSNLACFVFRFNLKRLDHFVIRYNHFVFLIHYRQPIKMILYHSIKYFYYISLYIVSSSIYNIEVVLFDLLIMVSMVTWSILYHVCFLLHFFINCWCVLNNMVCLQGNGRERRNVQSSLLWDMSLRPSHAQERMRYIHLPTCPRVCFTFIVLPIYIYRVLFVYFREEWMSTKTFFKQKKKLSLFFFHNSSK